MDMFKKWRNTVCKYRLAVKHDTMGLSLYDTVLSIIIAK